MKYSINLVRQARLDEHKAEKLNVRLVALNAAGFGVLALALFYGLLQVLGMNQKIDTERQNLLRIEAEYGKYKETKMVINKADIELLDRIQSGRTYWTKKTGVHGPAFAGQLLDHQVWLRSENVFGRGLRVYKPAAGTAHHP